MLVILLVLIAALAGTWQLGLFDRLLEGEPEVELEGAPVRRGDLRISEVVRGNLEATDSITLKCDVEGRSTIIFLAEEGVMLEAGDLVCELDVSQLEDELVRQEIEVKNAEAAFTKAKEQYEIQVIQNESDIAQAILALELAELDLAKYVGDAEAGEAGEWFNELASAQETVTLRQEDLRARDPDPRCERRARARGLPPAQPARDGSAREEARADPAGAGRARPRAQAEVRQPPPPR